MGEYHRKFGLNTNMTKLCEFYISPVVYVVKGGIFVNSQVLH